MGTNLENISHELSRSSLIHCMVVQETEFVLFYRNKTKDHQNKQQKEEIKVCILAWEGKRNILNIFTVISVFLGQSKSAVKIIHMDDYTGDIYFGNNQPATFLSCVCLQCADGQKWHFYARVNSCARNKPQTFFVIYYIYWSVLLFHASRNKVGYLYNCTTVLCQQTLSAAHCIFDTCSGIRWVFRCQNKKLPESKPSSMGRN